MTIISLVARERSRLRRLYLAVGVGLVIGATCLLLALGASVLGGARWLTLPRSGPWVIWLVVLGADAAVLAWTFRRLSSGATHTSVAASIEREQSMRAGSVSGVLEVASENALGRLAAAQLSERLSPVGDRLAPAAHRRAWTVVWRVAAVAIVAVLSLGWAAPVFDDGLLAILRPVDAWRGSLVPRMTFENLPAAVLRGEEVRVDVFAPKRTFITVHQRVPGEAWKSELVPVDRARGVATLRIGPVRGDLTLVASDGRTATDTMVVRATDRPFVGAVAMRAIYPAYLGRAPEGLPVGEPARVPQGTTIEISGRASTTLRDVRLVSGSDSARLAVNDHAFAGRLAPRASGHWNWLAAGASGPITDLPLPVDLDVIADSAPRVELVSPATDTLVASDDRVVLHVTATDDHGLSRIELVSWQQPNGGARPAPTVERLAEWASTVWNGSPMMDLAPRGLKPGDALHVKIVATDNSPWAQRGESRELLLKIPTMEERRAIARELADSTVSRVQAAARSEKTLEQRTSEAARDRTQRPAQEAQTNASGSDKPDAMSYDAAEKAKALAKDQRALADQIKQLQDQAAALQQQLKQAGALDSSLSRQLQEAQALLRDAITPQMLEQMKKLEDAGQQLSKDQAQQTLRDMQAMQQRLREQLEKSAEMLKRAAIEGSMQTLKDEAQEISDRERSLADSAAARAQKNAASADSQSARNLADRSQRFADELNKLEQRLDQAKADAGKAGTEDARQHAQASEEAMRQASGQKKDSAQRSLAGAQNDSTKRTPPGAQNAQDGRQGGAQLTPQNGRQGGQGQQNSQPQQRNQGDMQQAARDAAAQMQRAEQSMQGARDSQVQQWKQELNSALDQSIQEMLQMAREEGAMEQKARSGQSNADELRGQQSAVKQGVDNAAKRLDQEGQKTSILSGRSQRAVGDAQQKVAQATQSSADPRNVPQTATAMGEAADALNRAAASLARDREKANTTGSATGFAEMIQQMQDMAKKQGSINAQAEGLIPGLGKEMSAQTQATARALAREQHQVAEQLDELGDAAGGDRAAQLAKEARQLADALDGGRIDGTTLARQQQLFRRLLDAGRSLEKDEREDTNKREAQSATGDNGFKPDNTSATGRSASRFREPSWDELRGLTADERRAILDYFKRINGKP